MRERIQWSGDVILWPSLHSLHSIMALSPHACLGAWWTAFQCLFACTFSRPHYTREQMAWLQSYLVGSTWTCSVVLDLPYIGFTMILCCTSVLQSQHSVHDCRRISSLSLFLRFLTFFAFKKGLWRRGFPHSNQSAKECDVYCTDSKVILYK